MTMVKVNRGSALLEVMVTIIILAIGMLGLAGMQARVVQMEQEAYQQAQAVTLVNDMVDRMNSNTPDHMADYVSATPYGKDYDNDADCELAATMAARDVCEWSALLKGASIVTPNNPLGGIGDARGCVREVVAPVACAAGVSTPGVYQIDVVWRGKSPLFISAVDCGKDLYGSETVRRAASARITIGTPTC